MASARKRSEAWPRVSPVFENEGGGCSIIYDLPSPPMVLDGNPQLLSAALSLEDKLAALIERVT